VGSAFNQRIGKITSPCWIRVQKDHESGRSLAWFWAGQAPRLTHVSSRFLSPFFYFQGGGFAAEASLAEGEMDESKNNQLPSLWSNSIARHLEKSKREGSDSNQMSSMSQLQSMERRTSSHIVRRDTAALLLPRLRLSVFTMVRAFCAFPLFFFLSNKLSKLSRRRHFEDLQR
jgi:hypothetical protein